MHSYTEKNIYTETNPIENEEISLKILFLRVISGIKYIKSKWLVLTIFTICGGIMGLGYAILKKPQYTALCTFVLEDGGSGAGLGQYSGLASMVGIDVGGGNTSIFQGENIVELYRSRKMIEQTLLNYINYKGKKTKLIDLYVEVYGLKEKWAKNQLSELRFDDSRRFDRTQDSLITEITEAIRKNILNVSKPDKKLSIIEVTVKSINEVFSKEFNDRIVKNVNDFYIHTMIGKSLENVNILQHQVDSVKSVLTGSLISSTTTLDATPNLNPTRQVLRVGVQKSQFNAEASKAILTEMMKNLELSKIALRKETPLIQVIDPPIYPLKRENMEIGKGLLLGSLIALFITSAVLTMNRIMRKILK